MNEIVQRLRNEVIEALKVRFVGRDEVVDLIALALVSGEHLFLLGPPGTAKSALIRQFAGAVRGRYFEYMLTRFSEPNEMFGPIDIGKLREGTVSTITTGMLPQAEFAFLDEIFNANSAILNNMLTVLNERVYRRGAETHELPLLSLFSASNQLPDDDALRALFDRFLLRCHVENLPRNSMPQLLSTGWALERPRELSSSITAHDLRTLAALLYEVDLKPVAELYADTVFKLRDIGIAFSDRRAVKAQKLVAASALLCARKHAVAADLWVMRYLWDREEQIAPLANLVNAVLEQHPSEKAHELARAAERVDGEDLARQLESAASEATGKLSLGALARLKERVTQLVDRAAWVSDSKSREHLVGRARKLLEQLA